MKLSTRTSVFQDLANPNSKKTVTVLSLLLTPILIAILALSSLAHAIPVTMDTVRPADISPISDVLAGPAGWYEESVGTGNVEPTTTKPYNVAGSAEFTVSDPSSYVELGLYKELTNAPLSSLTGLSYATWQNVDNTKAVSLQIGMDTDVTDTNVSWQGRMVYEPYNNVAYSGAPVTDGIWQTWLTLKPASQWWMTWSSSLTSSYGANPCPQSDPCSYSEITGLFPNIGFNAGFGNPLILKAGSGWSSFTGFADVPAIGTAAAQRFWDFEPAAIVTPVVPVSKDDCKKDGWQNFNGMFKNQGACVSYVVKSK